MKILVLALAETRKAIRERLKADKSLLEEPDPIRG